MVSFDLSIFLMGQSIQSILFFLITEIKSLFQNLALSINYYSF